MKTSFQDAVVASIKQVMQDEDIDQRVLAKKMKVTEQRVSNIFNKDTNITLRTLNRVFAALGYSPVIMLEKR